MALVAVEMVERRVAALILLVDQDRMTLREGTALAILAGQAHVMALLQQGAERQRLAGRPIEADAALDRLGAVLEEAADGAVDTEAVRHLGDLAADLLEHRGIDTGDAATCVFFLVGNLEASPFAVEPVGLVRLVAGAGLELGVETRAPIGLGLVDLAVSDHAFG